MARRVEHAAILPKSAALGLLVLVCALAACEVPHFEGPQLQDPPRGFLLNRDAAAPTAMFGGHPSIYDDAWVQTLPPYSTIRINGYRGTLTLEDVMVAQDSGRAHIPDPDITFGDIEPVAIDGRDAWGWEERIDTPRRGIPWVAYRVMVPYDTISYTIEVSTEDPLLKAEAPESLEALISSFGVGEVVYNWPLILLGMGLLFFAVHMARQKARAKAQRLQSINLVKIEKKKDQEAEDAADTAQPSSMSAAAATATRSVQTPVGSGAKTSPE